MKIEAKDQISKDSVPKIEWTQPLEENSKEDPSQDSIPNTIENEQK